MVAANLTETGGPKRQAIMAAATELFIELGYASASMEEVARRAGVAKQTLYNHFGSKSTLFQAIVEQICDDLMATVNVDTSPESAPAAVLGDFARRFVTLMVAPTSIGLFRLLAADAHRFPDLAEAVFRSGPDRVVADLARYLEAQHRSGRLAVEDAKLSAESFIGSLRGNLEIKALFSAQRSLSALNADKARLERYSRHCIDRFLAAHAVR
ncbi:MAG: TetR/AcrR family transcriptional regulator [Reyranellaceae bacterium]